MKAFYFLLQEGVTEYRLLEAVRHTIEDADIIYDKDFDDKNLHMLIHQKAHDDIGIVRVISKVVGVENGQKQAVVQDAYVIDPNCKKPCCMRGKFETR